MMLLGVTGCPGSGKSILAKDIAAHGWTLVDADAVGKEVVESGEGVLGRLADAFGSDILQADGCLDRRKLAKRAFSSRGKTRLLNDIVHPSLVERLRELITGFREENRDAVIDCALIFEWGIENLFDILICVFADEDLRIKRLIERDGRSEAEIGDMFAAQLPEEIKIRKSHIAIANNGSPEDIRLMGAMLADLPEYCRVIHGIP